LKLADSTPIFLITWTPFTKENDLPWIALISCKKSFLSLRAAIQYQTWLCYEETLMSEQNGKKKMKSGKKWVKALERCSLRQWFLED